MCHLSPQAGVEGHKSVSVSGGFYRAQRRPSGVPHQAKIALLRKHRSLQTGDIFKEVYWKLSGLIVITLKCSLNNIFADIYGHKLEHDLLFLWGKLKTTQHHHVQ